MPKASDVVYYLLHVQELRSIIQWKTWHSPVHDRDESKETETQKICFKYLEKTSRSFAAVIKELHPELLIPVCLFYLILRGLDTVEDDTSIPAKTKEPVLRRFHEHLEEDGWCFTENRPEEKDRDLLVNFKHVISEFKTVKPVYKKIIADITDKMGNGMADYCLNAEFNEKGVDKIEDYDLYCYYVAGLVGEGLTRMFVESGFGNPGLMDKPNLMISMGLFLQKTNIIRDIKEDHDDNRRFWPREIWSRYVDDFSDLVKPENREKALHCSSDMVLNALNHADECLFYLAGLREQSVFNFCAIPQGMAIATLALCFRNPTMFERNIKISKGEACQLMIESTQNLQVLCETFKRYTKIIRKKNDVRDPNFLKISLACGKIEQFIEALFPTSNMKALLAQAEVQKSLGVGSKPPKPQDNSPEVFMLLAVSVGAMFCIMALMFFVAYLAGARFDLALAPITEQLLGLLSYQTPPSRNGTAAVTSVHKEL